MMRVCGPIEEILDCLILGLFSVSMKSFPKLQQEYNEFMFTFIRIVDTVQVEKYPGTVEY